MLTLRANLDVLMNEQMTIQDSSRMVYPLSLDSIFDFLSDVMPRNYGYQGVLKHAPILCDCAGIDLTGETNRIVDSLC